MSHHQAPRIAAGSSLGCFTLNWLGSSVHAGLVIVAGIDFSQLTADLARLGTFIAAIVAAGSFGLTVYDRIRGRARKPAA